MSPEDWAWLAGVRERAGRPAPIIGYGSAVDRQILLRLLDEAEAELATRSPVGVMQFVAPAYVAALADRARRCDEAEAIAGQALTAGLAECERLRERLEAVLCAGPRTALAEYIVRRAQRAESERDRLRQDRADALTVHTREGLLASEWLLRTGKAERERDEARADAAIARAEERAACIADVEAQSEDVNAWGAKRGIIARIKARGEGGAT